MYKFASKSSAQRVLLSAEKCQAAERNYQDWLDLHSIGEAGRLKVLLAEARLLIRNFIYEMDVNAHQVDSLMVGDTEALGDPIASAIRATTPKEIQG